jgi:hypothetical protein
MPFPFSHHPGWAAVSCACLCVVPAAASAQILDRIEVSRSNGHAEIRIDFAVQVLYQRHTPPGKGNELNIFIKPINAPSPESEVIEETLSAPETDIVPPFKVLYPHLGSAVSIRFAQETEWNIRPTPDGRSIVVVVPVLRVHATSSPRFAPCRRSPSPRRSRFRLRHPRR